MSKATFDNEFSRGRCPQRFYQLGEECVFFPNDGKSHAWKRANKICADRIGGILNDASAGNSEQPNMQPTNGARQLVLNTPEKTEILRALFRDYQEQNFAIRLPSDYQTLVRCNDGQDDKWPQFCSNAPQNSSCFEAIFNGPNDICLREVDCNSRYLRLACEFTLPGLSTNRNDQMRSFLLLGSPELIGSTFRNCPPVRGRARRLPKWAWIAIILGSTLLLVLIIGVILALICKKKREPVHKKRAFPEPRQQPEKRKIHSK